MKRPDQIKKAPEQGYGERVPPGQFVTNKSPVLTYGPTPKIDLDSWRLRIFGEVENEIELTWDQFTSLPWSHTESDFHCVTQWSALDNSWEGVLVKDVLNMAMPKLTVLYVMAHCYGGYTTNLPFGALLKENTILAHKRDGKELEREHGWPLRLVVPNLYGWKSAKWIKGLELTEKDRPGFWEMRGYNNNADPWKEERFWDELS